MRINFRQGLISFQQSSGTPLFIQQSGTAGFISHVASPTLTIGAFAHGESDYLQVFDTTKDLAWGPIPGSVTSYLYWDIDLLTANVSYGLTALIPVVGLLAPTTPQNDQHWFDLSTNLMKVWSTAKGSWSIKVRLFAGSVLNGSMSQLVPAQAGTQVGLQTASQPGYIVRDSLLAPLRKSNWQFLTAEEYVRVDTTVGTSGVLVQPSTHVVAVRAGESIPRMSLVYFSSDDTVRLASSDPALSPAHVPVGIVIDALNIGEIGTLAAFGELSYDQWDWTGHAGAALYIDSFGQATLTRPAGLLAYRVGFIKNKNTVLFDLDAETYPQVYQASISSVIIAGTTPVSVLNAVNGLGERTATISIPTGTLSQAGLISAAQSAQLVLQSTRLTTVESNITGLTASKANTVHTHIISDVTGLQPALDSLTSALANRITKVQGGLAGNFAALTNTGSLVDSAYSSSSFALTGHTHVIPDVTGLQTALNNKSNRVHLNAFAEIFTTVDRSTSVDTGSGQSLADVLAGKSNIGHVHPISDVTGLQNELNNRAYTVHTHVMSDVTGLVAALAGKANTVHTHIISDVTGLIDALNGKANSVHTHVMSDITGLIAALAGKANSVHTHIAADITDFSTATAALIKAGTNITVSYDSAAHTITIASTQPATSAATPLADTQQFGAVRLNRPANDPALPTVVGNNDPRLTDARTPLAHTHTFSYDMAFSIPGDYTKSTSLNTVVGLFLAPRTITASGTFVDSIARQEGTIPVSPTGVMCDFILKHNGVEFGRVRFTDSSSYGTFASSSSTATSIVRGDVITVTSPSSMNSFCKDVSITIVGYSVAVDHTGAI